jgi:hypothetical protein
MAFKAVIHSPANQEQMRKIYMAAAQYRAEKTAKYLGVMGVGYDAIRKCLQHWQR